MAHQAQTQAQPQSTDECKTDNKLKCLKPHIPWLSENLSKKLCYGQPKMVASGLLQDMQLVEKLCGDNVTKTSSVAFDIYRQWQQTRGNGATYEEMIDRLKRCKRNDLAIRLEEAAGNDRGKQLPLKMFAKHVALELAPGNIHGFGVQLLGDYRAVSEARLAELGKKLSPEEQMDAILEYWIYEGTGQPGDLVEAVEFLQDKKLENTIRDFIKDVTETGDQQ